MNGKTVGPQSNMKDIRIAYQSAPRFAHDKKPKIEAQAYHLDYQKVQSLVHLPFCQCGIGNSAIHLIIMTTAFL